MARGRSSSKVRFPIAGVSQISERGHQPDMTCANALNIRVFDTLEDRARGGIRPGLSEYLPNTFNGSSRIQDINYLTLVKDAPPNTSSLYVRETRAVAVSNGTFQMFDSTGINTSNTAGNSTMSNTAPFILSAPLFNRMYYTDGLDYKEWVGSNNVAQDWTLTAGTLPGDPGNTACRLIELWDGRIVMSGLRTDPHNWFMSTKGDALDWDYSPNTTTELQAVTGGTGVVGKIGDVINAMIPYSDDILIFGCDHSIWQMSGNPMTGGRVDNISTTVGMPFGRPWAKDPEGNVYFFSTLGDVYVMPPHGAKPGKISDNIHPSLKDVNLNTTFIRMEWDEKEEGLKLWLSPLSNGATTHWFWDSRTKGWFPDKYTNTGFNPISVKLFDGDDPDDRVILMGSEFGKIHFSNTAVSQDVNSNFVSQITLGPIVTESEGIGRPQHHVITGLQARTDINGVSITYEILSANTAEEAQQSEAASFVGGETFAPGLGVKHNPMKGGYYSYIKIGTNAAATPWALDEVYVDLEVITTDPGVTKKA